MLNIFYGNTGTGKSYEMMERIKERAAENEDIYVIVPDQFTFEYERMLYDHMGCRLYNKGNTRVLSFSRLVRDIFGKAGSPAGDAAASSSKTAAIYLAVKEADDKKQLGYYKAQAKKSSFTGSVSAMLSELIHSGVTPECLAEIAKKADGQVQDKLNDLLVIYTGYIRRLENAGLRDSLFDMQLAAEAARLNRTFVNKYIYIDGFKSFTGDQYEMIRTMLTDCAELTVCMTTDSSHFPSGPFICVDETCGSLENIARSLGIKTDSIPFTDNRRYKSEELFALSNALAAPAPVKWDKESESITLIKAPDLYSECSYICACITELVRSKGYRYRDIAVLDRSMNEHISVLAAAFDRYDIPFYSDKKHSAGHKPIMLMITAALELASGDKISTETLFRYAKTGLSGVSDADICDLENFCYSWDIDGDMWDKEFPSDDPETDNGKSRFEDIKNRLLAPIRQLREKCDGKNGVEICTAVRELISSTNAENTLADAVEDINSVIAENAELIRENGRICQELDGIIAGLERAFTPADGTSPEKISVKVFREIFMLASAGITLAEPPLVLDAAAAQQADLARLSDPKIVFVMGANDGVFPFIPSASVTFTEKERELFRNEGSDLSGSMKKRMSEERFNAFKALCAPSEALYISYNTASGDKPSELISKIRKNFPCCNQIDVSQADLLFYCRTEQAAYSAAAQHFDPSDTAFVSVRSRLEASAGYKSKFEYLDKVRTQRTSKHRINDTKVITELYNGNTLNISASRFEDYSVCPFKYYCSTGLKIKPLQKYGLTHMNWGNAVHACMKAVTEQYDRDAFILLTKDELESAVALEADNYVQQQMHGSFAKHPSFPFYFGIMKANTLRALIRLQDELRVSKFTPHAFEISIGKANGRGKSNPPIIVQGDNGHLLNFFGTADRVDVYEEDGNKYIRVIDYKTGTKKFKLDQIENGLDLQMFLYLNALTDASGGIYKDYIPAGVLYVPVKAPEPDDERETASEKLLSGVDGQLRMAGEIIDDGTDIINAMENINDGESGRFIPVDKNDDGTVDKESSVITRAEFEYIRQRSDELMRDMCRNVYDGVLPSSPLKSNFMGSSRCDICDYRNICKSFPDVTERAMVKYNKKK